MKRYKKLTLLHSNDLHGDFFSEENGDATIGGASRLSGYISKVREEEDNVIYAIAGDMFRGSVIDSDYKGMSTIEIMNMISPMIQPLHCRFRTFMEDCRLWEWICRCKNGTPSDSFAASRFISSKQSGSLGGVSGLGSSISRSR